MTGLSPAKAAQFFRSADYVSAQHTTRSSGIQALVPGAGAGACTSCQAGGLAAGRGGVESRCFVSTPCCGTCAGQPMPHGPAASRSGQPPTCLPPPRLPVRRHR